jgi:GNAT superfamily N-acetyltransferase
LEVRRANESHIAGIAAARLSNGPAHDDSGANADYCRYLIADGHLFVAVDGGDVLGFGGAIDIGAARLLSDLYVHREAHGRGVGSALLAAVMGDSTQRLTFASNDPAALPLYARAGMVAWWPLLAVSGTRSSLRPALGCDAFDVSVHQAAEYELVATHLDRSATYRYWAGRSSARTLAVERDGRRIAVAAVLVDSLHVRIEHLLAHDADALDALAAITHLLGVESVELYVPGCRAFAAKLFEHRFVIDDTSVFMGSTIDLVAPMLQVVHPGLC